MKKGLFITIEGPDGAGKTSIQKEAARILSEEGFHFELTREPGGIDIAEQIREIILNPKNTAMDARTEALLYAASRRQHLAEKVIPYLDKGINVLCDRFVDSSLAYQGYGRGIGVDQVFQMNQFAIQDTMPDLTLFMMLEPEIGLERINRNRAPGDVDRLDMEKIDFHKKVYEAYCDIAKKYPSRIEVIDASKCFEEVLENTVSAIRKYLKKLVNTIDK
ncbi:MAG: dTMP kinase [Bacillales bacterium]|jgi:dTMP kinase|nr:dTMP kinase [Bacillales bacterium]